MQNIQALAFFILAIVCVSRFIRRLGDGCVSFLDFFLLGFGVFMAFDVVAHTWIRPDAFRYPPEAEVFLGFLTMASLALVLMGYYLGNRIGQVRPRTGFARDTRLSTRLWIGLLLPLTVALLCAFFLLSGYLGSVAVLVAFAIRAMALVLIAAGILQRRTHFVALGVALFFVLFFQSEELSRRAYIVPIFVVLLVIVGTAGTRQKRENSKAGRYISGLSLVAMAVLSVVLRVAYNVREGDTLEEHVMRYLTNVTPIDTFTNSLRILEIFPDKAPYMGLGSYSCAVLNWLPRDVRPWDTYSIAPFLGYYALTGSVVFNHADWKAESSYSLTPGIIGEAWASFGLLGAIVVPFLFGVLIAQCDRRLVARRSFRADGRHRLDDLPLLVWMPAFLLLGRGDMYSAAYYSLPTSIILLGMLRVMRTGTVRRVKGGL